MLSLKSVHNLNRPLLLYSYTTGLAKLISEPFTGLIKLSCNKRSISISATYLNAKETSLAGNAIVYASVLSQIFATKLFTVPIRSSNMYANSLNNFSACNLGNKFWSSMSDLKILSRILQATQQNFTNDGST